MAYFLAAKFDRGGLLSWHFIASSTCQVLKTHIYSGFVFSNFILKCDTESGI